MDVHHHDKKQDELNPAEPNLRGELVTRIYVGQQHIRMQTTEVATEAPQPGAQCTNRLESL
jgi:hypothetical protein